MNQIEIYFTLMINLCVMGIQKNNVNSNKIMKILNKQKFRVNNN